MAIFFETNEGVDVEGEYEDKELERWLCTNNIECAKQKLFENKVKLHELAQIDPNDAKKYAKQSLGLDEIEAFRFSKAIKLLSSNADETPHKSHIIVSNKETENKTKYKIKNTKKHHDPPINVSKIYVDYSNHFKQHIIDELNQSMSHLLILREFNKDVTKQMNVLSHQWQSLPKYNKQSKISASFNDVTSNSMYYDVSMDVQTQQSESNAINGNQRGVLQSDDVEHVHYEQKRNVSATDAINPIDNDVKLIISEPEHIHILPNDAERALSGAQMIVTSDSAKKSLEIVNEALKLWKHQQDFAHEMVSHDLMDDNKNNNIGSIIDVGLKNIMPSSEVQMFTETFGDILKQHKQIIFECRRLMEFEKRFLPQHYDGMITCPNQSTENNSKCPDNKGNDKAHLPNGDPNRNNNDSNGNEQRNDGGNGNNNKRNTDYNVSCGCTHLNECSECAHILKQKHEQIHLFKDLICTLQKQHEYHTSFENMLCKAIVNGNNKRNKKPKSAVSLTDKSSYDPIYKAKKNIKISRKLSGTIIPQMVKEPISKVYSYLNKYIGMQFNDRQIMDVYDDKMVECKYKIINVDLHDKISDESLYCVAQRVDSTKNAQYKWKINDQLFKASDLSDFSGLSQSMLPQSSRAKLQSNDIDQFTFNTQSVKDIIKKCKYNSISVFKRKNNAKRMTLSITQEQLNPMIKRSLLNIENHKDRLIPILMFDDHSHWIEHILIVNIQRDIDIGISLRYNEENGVQITGIHLDKDMIFEQHEILSPHKCHCLDGFTSIIHDIRVGNPDTLSNQIKNYKQRYHALKQLILKFINGKDTEKYEILQKHAEMAIKHDNGSLSYSLYPISSPSSTPNDCGLLSPQSISSLSSYSDHSYYQFCRQ